VILTTLLNLGSRLRESGTLSVIPPYAFVMSTSTSTDSSQLHVLGLVVVFHVIDIRLSSLFYSWFVYASLDIGILQNPSLFLGEKKSFSTDVSVS
jgi:hypothetical protein